MFDSPYDKDSFPGSIRQRALKKSNFVVMGFVTKVLWQDHTFVMKCTLNVLCLLPSYDCFMTPIALFNTLFSRESTNKRTDRQSDGCYQVHYIPRFAVDKKGKKMQLDIGNEPYLSQQESSAYLLPLI